MRAVLMSETFIEILRIAICNDDTLQLSPTKVDLQNPAQKATFFENGSFRPLKVTVHGWKNRPWCSPIFIQFSYDTHMGIATKQEVEQPSGMQKNCSFITSQIWFLNLISYVYEKEKFITEKT